MSPNEYQLPANLAARLPELSAWARSRTNYKGLLAAHEALLGELSIANQESESLEELKARVDFLLHIFSKPVLRTN